MLQIYCTVQNGVLYVITYSINNKLKKEIVMYMKQRFFNVDIHVNVCVI